MAATQLTFHTLDFYRAYGNHVLYWIMPNWGVRDDHSVHVEKSVFSPMGRIQIRS